ncbi:hypothetical protein MKS88_000596 [Plasmodium brasilianum]|uniref:Uncharacterized protein n=1 Tax=Plasmodium brasilianum TaxID=5824 RepID=A0ACB9YGY9_PLABR|nr:hypothetical protein MKS88_000596 [Plasmodium brasilianum]
MASVSSGKNENSVTLFLKYKEKFDNVILDTQNVRRGKRDETPGNKYAKMHSYRNFTSHRYNKFLSQTENTCIKEIKSIPQYDLDKHKKLYSYYKYFKKFNVQDKDSDGNICNKIVECQTFYKNNYQECEQNRDNTFCEELINFKKAYDNNMLTVTPWCGLPHILQPTQV